MPIAFSLSRRPAMPTGKLKMQLKNANIQYSLRRDRPLKSANLLQTIKYQSIFILHSWLLIPPKGVRMIHNACLTARPPNSGCFSASSQDTDDASYSHQQTA
jgi:hypothetical protein